MVPSVVPPMVPPVVPPIVPPVVVPLVLPERLLRLDRVEVVVLGEVVVEVSAPGMPVWPPMVPDWLPIVPVEPPAVPVEPEVWAIAVAGIIRAAMPKALIRRIVSLLVS
jgi:hypothetical protein